MKKILFAYDVVEQDNEYVKRLAEIVQSIKDTEVFISLKEFWEPTREYDFVFINWPEYLFNWRINLNERDIYSLESRFNDFKIKNTKILTVLHDEYAHSDKNYFTNKIFDICYQQCDVLIHLGDYSYKKYKEDVNYSHPKNVIIYHPLFKEFNFNISKSQARNELGLNEKDFYIIVPGGIRHQYEYKYVLDIFRKINIKNKKLHFLRSTGIKKPERGWNAKFLLFKIKEWIEYKRKGIKHYHKFMDTPLLSKYFSACDLVILPRVDILNSGNITLATQFKKLIIGSEIGNIKEWLIRFNHVGIDFKYNKLNNEDLTRLINQKIQTFLNSPDINEFCSDEVVKKQIESALGL